MSFSTCDCVSISCRTRISRLANSVDGFKKWPLHINIPLSQSLQSVRLQASATLLGGDGVSSKSWSAGVALKLLRNREILRRSRNYVRKADEFDVYRELGLKEKEKNPEIRQIGGSRRSQKQQELADNPGNDSSSSDFLEELDISGKESVRKVKEDNLMRIVEGSEGGNVVPAAETRSGKQMMNRSSIIAKQVISIQSALSLGFVSQLWVDTSTWLVLVVEVRPNLLSGELERCLLEDITKVGDVLLVEDEHVLENDFKLVGLETLVGYTVVTPGQRNIGKVRGYTFNINSGAVELLELDSFGISIIPSGLVSTYALLVEDVLEVLPDTVVVHEAAASRIQRLTKGLWGAQKMGDSVGEFEEYSDERGDDDAQSGYGRSKGRKFQRKAIESSDNWELPMDYL